MNFFCSIPNHTYASIDLNDDRLMTIKDNKEFIGFLGKKFDDLLIKKHLRKCKLIGGPNFGEKLDNGTFTDNLGLLQKGDAILYFKSEAPLIDTITEKWMRYLLPFHAEKFVIVQDLSKDIEKKSLKENSSNVLNCFYFDFISIFSFILANLLSLSLWILFKLLLSKPNLSEKEKRRTTRKRISIEKIKIILINLLNGQWDLDYSKFTKISIFVMFYSLHLWFIQLIISNNIKTDKVIVDQTILIKDENEALNTKKTFCLFESEIESSIALSSNSNILGKLYQKKNFVTKPIKGTNLKKGDRCFFKKSLAFIDIDVSDLFTIISEVLIWLFKSVAGTLKSGLILWFYDKPMLEMTYHFIVKNQKDLIDTYDRITLLYTELGIYSRYFDSYGSNSMAFLLTHIVYRTIEDFVDGNTKFVDLNTDSFESLLKIYISLCSTILIINLLHCFIGNKNMLL